MFTSSLHRLRSLFHPRAQLSRNADGTTEYECRNADVALAVCADSLRPDVARLEVRIGRDLAESTNPEKLKTDVHRAARSFVRDGRTTYALSVDWADALERQDRVYVRIHPRAGGPSRTRGGRRPSAREADEVRREIADEFAFAIAQLKAKAPGPVIVEELTVVCRDAATDAWLSVIAADGPAFSRSLKTLAEKHARVAEGFRASYRFETEMPGTTAVGQGLIAVDVVPRHGDRAAPNPRPATAGGPAHSATYEICDEHPPGARPLASVTFVGLGRDTVPEEPSIRLELPAVINRDVLSSTSLGRDAESLRTVSDSNPLHVDLRDGRLWLCANARRSPSGSDRPGYFLVDGDREIPLVGERSVVGDAEILIGSESHRTGRSPRGAVLRPPRIRVAAVRSEGSS